MLLDFEERDKGRGDHGPEPRWRAHADNEDSNDLKRRILAPGRGELRPTHKGHGGNTAGFGIVLRGIHSTHGCAHVSVKLRDELFCLLLRIANETGAVLGFLSLSWEAEEQGQ